MKLILENWRRFLKEQGGPLEPMDPADIKTPVPPHRAGRKAAEQAKYVEKQQKEAMARAKPSGKIQIHNAATLFKYFETGNIKNLLGKGWGPKADFEDPSLPMPDEAKQFINYMVVNNAIFQEDKIVDFLGAGAYGFVVQLEVGNALKISVGSHTVATGASGETIMGYDPTGKSDIKRYQTSREKLFEPSGEAAYTDVPRGGGQSELNIYDQGEIETPFGKKWFYAEMTKLKTLIDEMEFVYECKKKKNCQKIRMGVELEVLFIKELAHLANLVDIHGAEAFQKEETTPSRERSKIDLGRDCCITIRQDQPSEVPELAKILGRGSKGMLGEKWMDAIFTLPRLRAGSSEYFAVGHTKVFLLDKTFAKNLFNQVKELLKTRTLGEIHDVRARNMGFEEGRESIPIIFDF